MSKFSKRGQRRVASAAAVAAVAAIGLSTMGAGGAAAGPLANGYKKTTGMPGEVVQIWRQKEATQITQTVANNPANRAAAFGGLYTAKLSKGLNGNIALKYIIGCQVDITGLSLDLGGSLSLQSAGVSGSLTLPLTPGQVKVVSVTDKDIKSGGTSSLQVQTSVYTPGCAGYASARSAVLVVAGNGYNTDDGTVNGSGTYMQSTLYGQPFSLG